MPFSPMSLVLMAALALLTMTTMAASSSGWGLEHPEKNPPSIREGSVRTGGVRTRRTYFIGGGYRGGK